MKFSVLAVLSAPLLVSAQGYGGGPASSAPASSAASSPAPSASAAPGEHLVQVGAGGGFTFSPNSITAKENETVVFQFVQPSGFQHSITQSSFANPCTPLPGGFDSGLQNPNMEFRLTITNASQVIWFYCKQTTPLKHCGANGMVGGINVPASSNNTVDAFVNAAKAVGDNEGPQTASGGLTGVGAVATAPASPATAAASAPSASQSSGANGQLTVGGSLMATLFALFALA